jgi:hypothetical protein
MFQGWTLTTRTEVVRGYVELVVFFTILALVELGSPALVWTCVINK